MDTDHIIRSLTERQQGLVARRQLGAQGISDAELAHRIARGYLCELSPRVLRLQGSPTTPIQRAVSAVLDAPPDAYLSHRSAAALWNIPGFGFGSPPEVVIPWQGRPSCRELVRIHYHCQLPPSHLVELRGCPVTSPALTLYLLAGSVGPARLERAVDNAMAQRLVSVTELDDLLRVLARRGRNGTRALRTVVKERLDDPTPVDSGLERRFERLALEIGVRLRRQVNLGGEVWLGRVDYVVEGTSGVVEVLSRRYHGSLSDRRRDQERFEALTREGFEVLTVWDDQIFHEPQSVKNLLSKFLGVGGPPAILAHENRAMSRT